MSSESHVRAYDWLPRSLTCRRLLRIWNYAIGADCFAAMQNISSCRSPMTERVDHLFMATGTSDQLKLSAY